LANHLRASAEILSENNVKAEIEIRHGDVAESILNEAKEEKHDLIVLGSSENSSLTGMLLGNVTQQIINRAESAVLIVK
jgi:universal stress protein A